jgi:hypothetical protein
MWPFFPVRVASRAPTGKFEKEKSAKQFEARFIFLMPSVDTWSNHPDNPRIGQDKQSIGELPSMTSRFDLPLLGSGTVGDIILPGSFLAQL